MEKSMEIRTSYKVYITKSSEAAQLIARGLREATPWSKSTGKTLGISSGPVSLDSRIPAVFHECGLFFALIEYRNGENWDNPEYTFFVC